jgi:hypothetical protein
VQIWVTSNIVREEDDEDENENGNKNSANGNGNASTNATPDDSKPSGSGSGSRVMRFLHAFAAVIGGGSPGDESGDDDGEEGETEHGADDTPGGATTAEEYDTSTFEFSEVEPDSPITPRSGNQKLGGLGRGRRRRRRRRRRERRWDWKEVGLKCMLPTGMAYFLMAWAEVARREWGSWYYYAGNYGVSMIPPPVQ